MLKNRIFYIILLLCTILIYIFTNTYYTLILLISVVILPVISIIIMFISRRSVSLSIDVPITLEKSNAGFNITVSNKGIIPVVGLNLYFALENQLMDTKITKNIYTFIGSRKNTDIDLEVVNPRVGTITLSVNKVRLYDCFGLVYLNLRKLPDTYTVIYPDMKDLEVLMEKPVETRGDGSRYSSDKKGMDVSEIFALREYTEGDEIRKIHWKLSLKSDELVVRDFSLPLNYSVFLLIELTKTDEAVMDTLVETYLSFSRSLLLEGINHNLAWLDGSEYDFHVRELNDFEDLEVSISELLSSFPYEGKSVALSNYMTSGYMNEKAILIYMTPEPDSETIMETQAVQNMKVIIVDNNIDKNVEQTLGATIINPEAPDEDIPEIWV